MPKISDEARRSRRDQILDAARICFQSGGLHATTMQDIIRESGLSAGAVYSYFKSKDDLIFAAVTSALAGVRGALEAALRDAPPASPATLMMTVLSTINAYARMDGYDLRRLALLGWSEAQRNDRLMAAMRGSYGAFRDQFVAVAATWPQVAADDRPEIARLLLSVTLGTVVQSVLLDDVAPGDISRGLDIMTRMDASDAGQ